MHEFKLRSDPTYVRRKLEERDQSICAICGVDCFTLRRKFQRMRKVLRAEKLKAMVEEGWPKTILQVKRSWWEADHTLAVAKGGGECGLDNYRTLCLRCHRIETGKLMEELRTLRSAFAAPEESSLDESTRAEAGGLGCHDENDVAL
ncbi:MAG TPA: HNH endonuclease [Fimbriimonadaceae bacterium]|nr:HNH endonuclease [Fimbriimonadaceae bacterium]